MLSPKTPEPGFTIDALPWSSTCLFDRLIRDASAELLQVKPSAVHPRWVAGAPKVASRGQEMGWNNRRLSIFLLSCFHPLSRISAHRLRCSSPFRTAPKGRLDNVCPETREGATDIKGFAESWHRASRNPHSSFSCLHVSRPRASQVLQVASSPVLLRHPYTRLHEIIDVSPSSWATRRIGGERSSLDSKPVCRVCNQL